MVEQFLLVTKKARLQARMTGPVAETKRKHVAGIAHCSDAGAATRLQTIGYWQPTALFRQQAGIRPKAQVVELPCYS